MSDLPDVITKSKTHEIDGVKYTARYQYWKIRDNATGGFVEKLKRFDCECWFRDAGDKLKPKPDTSKCEFVSK